MSWQIQWSKRAIKTMQKLDEPLKSRIWDSINNMPKHPESADIVKLKSKSGEYRLRVGDWRVKFRVDFIHKVYLITHVKHRKDIYK